MKNVFIALLCLGLTFCFMNSASSSPLASWSDQVAKRKIVEYVEQISSEGSARFLAPKERIAVFDVDGTLWVEKPLYAQFAFIMQQRAGQLKGELPKSEEALLALSAKLFEGVSAKQYALDAKSFLLETSEHPKFLKPYGRMHYKPMLELLNYLRSKKFKIILCTGSDENFVRSVASELFSVPAENVVAQNVMYHFDGQNGELVRGGVYRQPINLAAGKVSNLMHRIASQPVFAMGNSGGDLDMLQWVAASGGFAALLVHDDAEREYDYGKKNKLIAQAFAGSQVLKVSMKENFRQVF